MTKTSIAIWAILIVTAIAVTFFWANRPRRVIVDAVLPVGFSELGFSHDSFEALLQIYVSPDGQVDYAQWQESSKSVQQLDSYLAAVSAYSPDNTADRFPTRNDELAYWLYGYNAYVIKAVLDHWPITSVTDVKAPLEVVEGLGFFYQLRFSFGGRFLSLLAVETEKIRKQYKDARIHFVLNCASESCPVIRPELPTGDDLEQLLSQATRDFVNEPANVSVDHENNVVYLSKIFDWYKSDFIHDLRMSGKPVANGLINYVAQWASDDLADDLAQAGEYKIRFRDYDWDLNSQH